MAKTFLLSTTGAGTFTINDLGGRSFTHPVVDAPLHLEYTLEELRDSADLRSAIQAGTFTATFDGVAITTDALFDEYLVDFDHKQVKANTDAIAALDITGKVTWCYSFGENGNINGDRYLKTVGGSFSNVSPYIVPLACKIIAVSVKSEDGVNISYNIDVEDDAVSVHTEAVSTADSSFTSGLAIAVAAGSEIRLKYDHTGDNGKDVTATVYFEEA